MSRTAILVVPTHRGVGTTSVCLGLLRALERAGHLVGFCKPIAQTLPGDTGPERSTSLVRLTTGRIPPKPIPFADAERLLSRGDEQVLLERVVATFATVDKDAEVVVVEGLVPGAELAYADKVNEAMARALDARVVMVGAPDEHGAEELAEHLAITARGYAGRLLGAVVNKLPMRLGTVASDADPILGEVAKPAAAIVEQAEAPYRAALVAENITALGFVPRFPQLAWLRALDVHRQLQARILHAGDMDSRRIRRSSVVARTVPNALGAFTNGTLVITPADRDDVILAAALAALGGNRLAALLLTGDQEPDPRIMALCRPALDTGLPIFLVDGNSYNVAKAIDQLDDEVPADDQERVELVMNTAASRLDAEALSAVVSNPTEQRLSPPAFRHHLIEQARAANRRIVLPEGDEPRTLQAAAICQERGIARCVLLGDPDNIRAVAQRHGIMLPEGVEIIDASAAKKTYIEPLVELRKHKGMNPAIAAEQLTDTVVLGTMMLKLDEVDGLVSGAVHTTANTIRPALQLIKTKPGSPLVSSIFFMCLPDQVVVYGDCAVNPEPTAEDLAAIAMQSARSAEVFGIPPRVAMISYSTGTSGAGAEVERVAKATELARSQAPELCIDGPLQYDAAAIESVARSKAPDSKVAGRATVFVFPDLNTGNTTYKAVQRSAGVISIGPMLQGLAKPVNDLSRGALVEDIVYTIALTAIQAEG